MRRIAYTVLAGVFCLATAGSARAFPSYYPNAYGPPVSPVVERLIEAEEADRMNAESWTSDNPSLDNYYDRKAREVDNVLGHIEDGDSVPVPYIQHALDNSEASRY